MRQLTENEIQKISGGSYLGQIGTLPDWSELDLSNISIQLIQPQSNVAYGGLQAIGPIAPQLTGGLNAPESREDDS